MPQTLDIRMARAAKAEARVLRDPAQARHRSLLCARAALCALERERSAPPDADRALAGALQRGDAAAVELTSIPDTPDLRRTDEARLARDHAGVEGAFEAQLLRLVRQYRDGGDLDPANASPAELLAACIARTTERSRPSAGPSSSFGVVVGQSLSTPTPIVASYPQHAI
jgi:hypothetical protein